MENLAHENAEQMATRLINAIIHSLDRHDEFYPQESTELLENGGSD